MEIPRETAAAEEGCEGFLSDGVVVGVGVGMDGKR